MALVLPRSSVLMDSFRSYLIDVKDELHDKRAEMR